MKLVQEIIYVVEYRFRFSGGPPFVVQGWQACDPVLGFSLESSADAVAEARAKKYPNVEYRVSKYRGPQAEL